MQIGFRVGDIVLVQIGFLKECEVEEIAVKAECMKIDGTWYKASDIVPKIKAVLGRATYKKGLFGTRRTVQYT